MISGASFARGAAAVALGLAMLLAGASGRSVLAQSSDDLFTVAETGVDPVGDNSDSQQGRMAALGLEMGIDPIGEAEIDALCGRIEAMSRIVDQLADVAPENA